MLPIYSLLSYFCSKINCVQNQVSNQRSQFWKAILIVNHIMLLSLLWPTCMPAQTCDSGSVPCINSPKAGDTIVTGKLIVDAQTKRVPDTTVVALKINGVSEGPAGWDPSGYYTKKLITALAPSDQIEVAQSPGGQANAVVPESTPAQNALTQNYLALQAARGLRRPMVKAAKNSTPQPKSNCTNVPQPADPDAAVNNAKADGTFSPFGAVFDVLAAFTDAGNGAYPAAQSSIQTEVLGKVEWESQHYGYQNTTCVDPNTGQSTFGFVRSLDFSFGGSIGIYPEMVLENLTSTTETIAQPNARPMFQDAFHWTLGPRVNYPVASHGEIGAFANFGQNFLIDQVTSFKDGDNTVVATPVSNGVGRAAGFIEGGIQGRILGRAIWVAHDNKYDLLRPAFLIAGGVRKDWRYTRAGDLGAYSNPRDRVFFQFFVNLTQIVGYTNDIQKQAPASIRFGIDLDRGMLDQRIPTATRYYISADINLMNIFKPSTSSAAQTTAPQTPNP